MPTAFLPVQTIESRSLVLALCFHRVEDGVDAHWGNVMWVCDVKGLLSCTELVTVVRFVGLGDVVGQSGERQSLLELSRGQERTYELKGLLDTLVDFLNDLALRGSNSSDDFNRPSRASLL